MANTSGQRVVSFHNPYSEVFGAINEFDNRSGTSVKDWQKRMLRGEDCSTAYLRQNRKVNVISSGNWAWQWRDRPNSLSQWTTRTAYAWGAIAPGPLSTLTTLPVAVDNEAKSRFVTKMNAVNQSMDGGVALGEIRETLNGLRHPLKSLRDSIGNYISLAKKRGLREAKRDRQRRRNGSNPRTRRHAVMDALTGTYLEWKFGIQPLILDIRDLTKALDRMSGRILDMERIKASAYWSNTISDQTVYSNSQWVLAGAGMSGPQQMAQVSVRRSAVVNGRITYSAAVAIESHEPDFRREIGLTPRNFLPTLWNLLPWSWAVDTVFSVGSVIDAICAAYGNVKWCNQAIHWDVTETWDTGGTLAKTFSTTSNREDLGKVLDCPSIVQIKSSTYSRIPYEASLWTFVPRFTLVGPDPVKMLNLTSAIWQSRGVSNTLSAAIRNG